VTSAWTVCSSAGTSTPIAAVAVPAPARITPLLRSLAQPTKGEAIGAEQRDPGVGQEPGSIVVVERRHGRRVEAPECGPE